MHEAWCSKQAAEHSAAQAGIKARHIAHQFEQPNRIGYSHILYKRCAGCEDDAAEWQKTWHK
jgi:hypothetical protein